MDDLPRATVRLYGDLDHFVSGADRLGVADVPVGEPRSVKDLVESLGVPHVEIGLVLVDDAPTTLDHRIEGGERVAVYPPLHDLVPAGALPRPTRPARFVLDVHLGTLTRRLRTLGFDCWYRIDADDPTLARVAIDEDRVLLTRDRKLLMRSEIVHGYCPRSDDPDTQLREVVARFDLGDETEPFTRCVRCNGSLVPVELDDVWDRVPPLARAAHDRFARCDECGQVYWPGTHHDALRADLGDLL